MEGVNIEKLTVENNLMLKALCRELHVNSVNNSPRIKGEELLEKVKDLTEAGYSKSQIASMLGVSKETVALKRRMYKERDKRLAEEQAEIENLSNETGIPIPCFDQAIEFDISLPDGETEETEFYYW